MKKEMIYEGKAKKVYSTEDPEQLIVSYKDDATAFNGLKKGTIAGKGVINNQMTNALMQRLEAAGVPTHFIRQLSERDTLVKRVTIVPLEVIVRNISAGSFAKRYGVEEGIIFDAPTLEFSYKNDALADPLITDSHVLALKLATPEEIERIKSMALKVNDDIILADEISPDTCRLWDSRTGEKLDKDRFRRDLGGVEDAYAEIMRRLRAAG